MKTTPSSTFHTHPPSVPYIQTGYLFEIRFRSEHVDLLVIASELIQKNSQRNPKSHRPTLIMADFSRQSADLPSPQRPTAHELSGSMSLGNTASPAVENGGAHPANGAAPPTKPDAAVAGGASQPAKTEMPPPAQEVLASDVGTTDHHLGQ